MANGNILIVEDNEINKTVLNKILNRFGYSNVKTASNGKEAVDLVCENDFNLILMDCQMPIMDGFEATQAIRSMSEQKSNTPIIAVTANVMDEYRKKCELVGMNDFIGKPVDIKELRAKLEKWLSVSC